MGSWGVILRNQESLKMTILCQNCCAGITECWDIKKQHANKMSVTETTMRRMCGKTLEDRIGW